MKIPIEVMAFVVRNKKTGSILEIIPIHDVDDEVDFTYDHNLISSIDEIKSAMKSASEVRKKEAYFSYIEGKSFTLHGSAQYMPSIGLISVGIERKSFLWE